jgi:large subunit ribosomal protein L23
MAIKNFFKKKIRQPADRQPEEEKQKKAIFHAAEKSVSERIKAPKKPEKKQEPGEEKEKVIKMETSKKRTEDFEGTWQILKFPHVSEKASDLAKKNQYTFNVYPRANKTEIKKAIEKLYGVEVIGLKIINIPSRKMRLGRTKGWKPGYKKAIIKIKAGQEIEVLPR